ncbi:MAG: TatD family nuclease-associated radical SAM protein [Desulfuromonadaceae bacterium]
MSESAQSATVSTAETAYRIGNSLYLNITNRCSNRCTFCPKFTDLSLKGHNLGLDTEPTPAEVLLAVGDPEGIDEIVFCGFGEPLLRVDAVLQIAQELKQRGYRIRINTDGQANLVHDRSVVTELVGLVDCISVSLNAADATTYQKICSSPYGEAGFDGVCTFIADAVTLIPRVVVSAVTVPGVDIDACRALALKLGAEFRVREYQE